MFLSLPIALAQGMGLPPIDVQLVRPSSDSTHTLWVDDAYVPLGANIRYVQTYAHQPLRYVDGHGTIMPVLEHLVVGELLVTQSLGRIRGTLGVPTSQGSVMLGQPAVGLGDVHAEVKLGVVERPAVGVAVMVRASAPTATVDLLGAGGPTYGVQLVAHVEAGPALIAVNVGSLGVPMAEIGGLVWDDRFTWRMGAGMPVGPGGVSLEAGGQLLYTALDSTQGKPVEALVGGWYRFGPTRFVLRGGAGVGLNQGIGASRGRALLALAYEPTGQEDRDRDGLVDAEDLCPRRPEDSDGVADDDGCPEPTAVSLVVTDAEGNPLPYEASLGRDTFSEGGVEADAGTHRLRVVAQGYQEHLEAFVVPEGQPVEVRVALEPSPGVLRVSVVDPDGEPLDAALVVVDVITGMADMGEGELEVPAGEHVLVVETEEFFPAREEFTMPLGGLRHLEIQLQPVKARMTADSIQIDEAVLFETGSAEILEASDDLLGQVGDLMLIHDNVNVRVEGHTDDVGDEAFNLELSQERAEAVRDYLIMMHVPAERLEAVGYGETRPVIEDTTGEARAANRRVEFLFIDEESEP